MARNPLIIFDEAAEVPPSVWDESGWPIAGNRQGVVVLASGFNDSHVPPHPIECEGPRTRCGQPGFTPDSIVCAGCNGNCLPPVSIAEHQARFAKMMGHTCRHCAAPDHQPCGISHPDCPRNTEKPE